METISMKSYDGHQTLEPNNQVEHDVMSKDTLCGLGSWRPKCLQRLANHNVYTAIFIVAGMFRSMSFAYFTGTITTIEKVFGISSHIMGIVLSGNDISLIICGMAVTHFGGKGSRPLWISIGMLFSGAAYFIYGSCQLFWDGNVKYARLTSLNDTTTLGMCSALSENKETLFGNTQQPCDIQHSNIIPIVLIFIGQFIFGAGATAINTLGFTYMDDSVKKRNSPLYIGGTRALRSLGPTMGYLLASVCLQIYINPTETPEYRKKDPRWLGAWWLGFLLMGVVQILITIPMLLFPKHLPTKHNPIPINNVKSVQIQECHSNTSAKKDFILSLMRLLKNPIVIFDLMSSIPSRFGMSGMGTFMPKYLEAEFGRSASSASVFTGMSSKLMMMIGMFTAGLVIWKFKPKTIYISSWNVFVTATIVVILLTAMRLECDDYKFSGVSAHGNKMEITSTCSQNCNCDLKFDPVCVMGRQSFFSPCLAGCVRFNRTGTTPKMFYNCTCGSPELDNGHEPLTGISGYCPNTRGTCNLFYVYIALFATARLLSSTTLVGSLTIYIRSVQKRDKSLAMGLSSTIMSLFAYMPGQIVFGAIADSTCLVWKKTSCGKRGNCWHYNVDDLRYWFHGVTAGCYVICLVFDFLICILSRHINIYEEDSPEKTNIENSKLNEITSQETKKA